MAMCAALRWRHRPTGSWSSSATSPMAARTAPARGGSRSICWTRGRGLFLLGNHDHKLARLLSGRAVQAGRGAAGDGGAAGRPSARARAGGDHAGAGLAAAGPRVFRAWRVPHRHAVPPAAALRRQVEGPLARALFGQTTGRRQPDGFPERRARLGGPHPAGADRILRPRQPQPGRAALDARGAAGGTAVFLDTGAGKGGHLSWIDLPGEG